MDFMSDALFNGRLLRVLTVLDIFTRESLALHAGKGIRGEEVVAILERSPWNEACRRRSGATMDRNSSLEPWTPGRT